MTAYTSMHFRCHERLEARLVSLPRRRRALGQILRAFMATRWSEGCCYSCVAFFSMRPQNTRSSKRNPRGSQSRSQRSHPRCTVSIPALQFSILVHRCITLTSTGGCLHLQISTSTGWQYWGPSQPLDSSRKVRHHPRPPQTASIAVVCVRTSLVCVCVNEDTVPRTTPTRLQDLAETWNAETLSMRRGP